MRLALACTLLALSTPLAAQQAPEAHSSIAAPVAVTVVIPLPPGTPREVVEAGIDKSVPLYRTVPGLLRKYFTISEGSFGGVYLFTSRAAAEAWFSPAWAARVKATYGAPATVTYADVPVVLDNAAVPASVIPVQ